MTEPQGSAWPSPVEPSPVEHSLDSAGLVLLANHSNNNERLFEDAFCGGVLLDPTHVVTAAHCVESRNASTVDVVHGVSNICEDEPAGRVQVESLRFFGGSLAKLALLVTREPVEAAPAVVGDSPPAQGSPLIALGWGRTSIAGVPPCDLKVVHLTVAPADACDFALGDDGAGFCAIPSGDANTCDGDSGGPVLQLVEDQALVIGITESGMGCGPDDPGFNTLLTHAQAREALR